jgi:VIT1/CCC1 family predicted Fe2+/Mn2+ transporter
MSNHDARDLMVAIQRKELTEHVIYRRLAARAQGPNAEILATLSADEYQHYQYWRGVTETDVTPNRLLVTLYLLLATLFGLTFVLKIMEGGEERAQQTYDRISVVRPEVHRIFQDEKRHEHQLIAMIDERHLHYVGNLIQGLNDALIGLMGELAGLTFALQNTQLVGIAGLIGGIANFLASSASEIEIYLADRSETAWRSLKDAVYSGLGYLCTILYLLSPYYLSADHIVALSFTVVNVLVIIGFFTYYLSVVRGLSLRRMLATITCITLGIGLVSFAFGYLVKLAFNL